MAAHEPRADLLAGELVEKFLLIRDRKMGRSPPGDGPSVGGRPTGPNHSMQSED
jgi:hypothetical protein